MTEVHQDSRRIFIGTNTWGTSKGIYTCLFNRENGNLSEPKLAVESKGPANLILHPTKKFLYAGIGRHTGREHVLLKDGTSPLIAFAIEDEKLRQLNTVSSGGVTPTHGVIDQNGKHLLLTCHQSGIAVIFRIEEDGSLGERTEMVGSPGLGKAASHRSKPHLIVLSESERFAVVPEMTTDQCVVYEFDADAGRLSFHGRASSPQESAPRHFAFHPSYRFAYSANEHGSSITAFAWDEETGKLEPIQTISSLPSEYEGANRASDIHTTPDGRFLYLGNRGHDSIAIFAIDDNGGTLELVGHTSTLGRTPWAFHIDPMGEWMIVPNMQSDNVVTFRIDRENGTLTHTGANIEVSAPSCVAML